MIEQEISYYKCTLSKSPTIFITNKIYTRIGSSGIKGENNQSTDNYGNNNSGKTNEE